MTADNPAARVDLDAALTEAERESIYAAVGWRSDNPERVDRALRGILADRLAPLLAELEFARAEADEWKRQADINLYRKRAETAEAERDEARAERDIERGFKERYHEQWMLYADAVKRAEELVDWHETKADKARRFRPEVNGENPVMDKAADVHDDAARRLRAALADPEAS